MSSARRTCLQHSKQTVPPADEEKSCWKASRSVQAVSEQPAAVAQQEKVAGFFLRDDNQICSSDPIPQLVFTQVARC